MNTIVERWWNDSDRGREKYWERNPSQCHFFHYKSHIDWPGLRPEILHFFNGKITIWINKGRVTFNKSKVVTINFDHGSATRGSATLYYAARSNICKSRIYYRNSAIIYAVGYTTYRYFPKYGPRTVLQHPVWPFVTKMLETHGLYPDLAFIFKLVATKAV